MVSDDWWISILHPRWSQEDVEWAAAGKLRILGRSQWSQKQKNLKLREMVELFWIYSLNTLLPPFPGVHWCWPSRLSILLGKYLSASRRPQHIVEGWNRNLNLTFLASSKYAEFEVSPCGTRDFQPTITPRIVEEDSKFSSAAQPAFYSLFQDVSSFNGNETKKIKKHSSQKLLHLAER